jgi:hypothetical protein
MKKLLVLIALATLYSCGPKRLGCGPNRRCEVHIQIKSIGIIPQKNPETVVSGFLVLS